MRSFVDSRRQVWWVWVALDPGSRRVVAMVVGDRYEATARRLWDALPGAYREGAVVFSDFWAAYAAVVPEAQHVACGKADGLINHVERFWCTVRQRCSRFVRKALSFSKCPWNHVGALWYFIRHYKVHMGMQRPNVIRS